MSRRAAVVLLSGLVAAAPATNDLAATVLHGLAAVPERHARFNEVRTLAALTETLHSSGTLIYRRPGHLEKLTLSPKPEQLVIDGDRLSITEGNAAPRQLDLANVPALRSLIDTMRAPLDGDLATLENTYVVTASGDVGHWRLLLTPRRPALARLLRQATLEGKGNVLSVVSILQPNGDTQVTTIDPGS